MECLIANLHSLLFEAVTLSAETFLGSTILALKNVCINVHFGSLNNLYPCPQVNLLGTKSKNLSDCNAFFPIIISIKSHLLVLSPLSMHLFNVSSWLIFVGLLSLVLQENRLYHSLVY